MTMYVALTSDNPRLSYVINKNPNSPPKKVKSPTLMCEGFFNPDGTYIVKGDVCKPDYNNYLSTLSYNHPNFGYSVLKDFFKGINETEDFKPFSTTLNLSSNINSKIWEVFQTTLPQVFLTHKFYSIKGVYVKEVISWYRLLILLNGSENNIDVNKKVLLDTVKYLNPPYPILKLIRSITNHTTELEQAVTYNIKFDKSANLINSIAKEILATTKTKNWQYQVFNYPRLQKLLSKYNTGTTTVQVFNEEFPEHLIDTEYFVLSPTPHPEYTSYPVGDVLDNKPELYLNHLS